RRSSGQRKIVQKKPGSNGSPSLEKRTANRFDDRPEFGREKRRSCPGESRGKKCSIGRRPSQNGSSAGSLTFQRTVLIVILMVRDEIKLRLFGKANRARNALSLISNYIAKSAISPTS